MMICCVQSENLDNSMDHSNMSAVSHDAEDDKSLVLQYEGEQHQLYCRWRWCSISFIIQSFTSSSFSRSLHHSVVHIVIVIQASSSSFSRSLHHHSVVHFHHSVVHIVIVIQSFTSSSFSRSLHHHSVVHIVVVHSSHSLRQFLHLRQFVSVVLYVLVTVDLHCWLCSVLRAVARNLFAGFSCPFSSFPSFPSLPQSQSDSSDPLRDLHECCYYRRMTFTATRHISLALMS